MTSQQEDGSKYFRLPRNVLPSHYDLLIFSDLEALKFSGLVTIDLDVQEDSDTLLFNVGPKLSIGKALVSSEALKTESKNVVSLDVDKQHERASAKLGTKLPKGSKATITTAFEGEIDNSMMGFYRSTWEHEGKSGFYGLTQFEPTAARRAFPSFDEPAMKATYSFQMIHRKDTVALGNMPATSSTNISYEDALKLLRHKELDVKPAEANVGKTEGKTEFKAGANPSADAWTLTTFDKSPLLSTYLVAWANGPFEKIESSYKSSDGRTVPLRVFSTKEYIHQTQYLLDVTAKVLPVYEEVFEQPFMMPKCDTLVASDFDAGAMENAGLITGRTSVYLVDPQKTGLSGIKTTTAVQSHEVAHQWFGNLATLAWWTQLWLNESFATLMGEVIILDKCYPEWNSASEFIVGHLNRALSLDARRSSHPIEVPLQGEDVESAINQIFDAISYSKGASVLRMLAEMLGQDVFLKGVANYIRKHQFGNAETHDLWAGISEVCGSDVTKIMDSWVLKQGFPVITVTENDDSITVRQNRFLMDLKPDEDETLWYVPLMLKTADGKVNRDAVLDGKRDLTIPLKDAKKSSWKLNSGTIGVYRVAYSPDRLSKLGAEAAKKKESLFSLEDRVGLIGDAFTLAKYGYAKTSGALSLMKELKGDTSYLVNNAASGYVGELGSAWYEEPEEIRSAISALRRDIFGPLAKELGFEFKEGEDVETKQLRSTVIGAAAAADDEWVLEQMRANFKPVMESGDDSKIHPDLLRSTFMHVVRTGGEKEYETMYKVYETPSTPLHKIAAMLAMGFSKEEKLLKKTIDFMYAKVKEQDMMYFFNALAANRYSRRLLWQSTKEHFDELTKRFSGNFTLSRLLEYSFSSFSNQKDYDDVVNFFKDKDTKKFDMSYRQGLDAVKVQASWLSKDREDIKSWLNKEGYLK